MENAGIVAGKNLDPYGRLKNVRMSESERREAVAALRDAEIICALAVRVAGWIAALRAAWKEPVRRRVAQQ